MCDACAAGWKKKCVMLLGHLAALVGISIAMGSPSLLYSQIVMETIPEADNME